MGTQKHLHSESSSPSPPRKQGERCAALTATKHGLWCNLTGEPFTCSPSAVLLFHHSLPHRLKSSHSVGHTQNVGEACLPMGWKIYNKFEKNKAILWVRIQRKNAVFPYFQAHLHSDGDVSWLPKQDIRAATGQINELIWKSLGCPIWDRFLSMNSLSWATVITTALL